MIGGLGDDGYDVRERDTDTQNVVLALWCLFSVRTLILLDQSPTLVFSFNLNYLLNQYYLQMQSQWELGLQHVNFEGTQFSPQFLEMHFKLLTIAYCMSRLELYPPSFFSLFFYTFFFHLHSFILIFPWPIIIFWLPLRKSTHLWKSCLNDHVKTRGPFFEFYQWTGSANWASYLTFLLILLFFKWECWTRSFLSTC